MHATGSRLLYVERATHAGRGHSTPSLSREHMLAGRADGEDLAGAVDARSESEASLDSPRSPPKQSDQPGDYVNLVDIKGLNCCIKGLKCCNKGLVHKINTS